MRSFPLQHLLVFVLFSITPELIAAQIVKTERWKVFELRLKGPTEGNPFVDVSLYAEFSKDGRKISADGFYDGDGNYIVRFMPTETGEWSYITRSNNALLNNKEGRVACVAASKTNHGPVKIKGDFHFSYSDETAYLPFGTTSYAWIHQPDTLVNSTLRTLAGQYFNKIRMCVFPKWYEYNRSNPKLLPFEGTPDNNWDYSRFNPAFFRNLEKRVAQLDELGIEADIIIFHPYDKWGFSKMSSDVDARYVRYLVARLSAYKNIWWSIANEYDLMESKSGSDWNRIIDLVSSNDPYRHLLSIHQAGKLFDHSRSAITHVSVQNENPYLGKDLRDRYRKPVIYDECRYEGNIRITWGNLTAEELVNKFYRGFTAGVYVGHGETYTTEKELRYSSASDDVLWWSKGGALRGKSPARIKFMRSIFESAPGPLEPADVVRPKEFLYGSVGFKDEFFLAYFNLDQPGSAELNLPDRNYSIEIIDTWNMTIKKADGRYTGTCLVELPQKPGTLLRITRIN